MQPVENSTAPPSQTKEGCAIEVPDYQLLRCIGKGSYGEVWAAHSVLGQPRAVKLVRRSRFADARPYEREFSGILRMEALSRSHEGFVDILHVGRREPAGYFYYVMELADDAQSEGPLRNGTDEALTAYQPRTLARELKSRGRLPISECIALGLNLADALAHLHRGGLVHRDVKPSNILYVGNVPKLGDIGLVGDTGETASYVGTEGYIPPEGPGSPQADIYSLGKVLYEIATGQDRLLFPTLPPVIDGEAEKTQLAELNAVVLKACAPDVLDRYASAEELHADLGLLHRGQSVRRQRAASRRSPWLALGLKLALFMAGVGVGVLWSPRNRGSLNLEAVSNGTLKPQPVDLSAFYNSSIQTNWMNDFEGNDLASLPTNWHRFGATYFKAAGAVQLAGGYLQNRRLDIPDAVEAIPVNRKCSRIHFLHGTSWAVEKGERVGGYVVKWADGREEEIPIRFGHELANWWWGQKSSHDADAAQLAWTGTNRPATESDAQLRLYCIVWHNRHPAVPVASISAYSTRSASAPFLLAITTE